MAGKVGRPAGSKNKILLNKTYTLQQCFTSEDIVKMADKLKERFFSDETTNAELVAIFNSIGKFLFLSVDKMYEVDSGTEEVKKTKEELTDLIKDKLEKLGVS